MGNHRKHLVQAAFGWLIVWVAFSVFHGEATAYAATGQGNREYQDDSTDDPDAQNPGEEAVGPDGSQQGARSAPRSGDSTQSQRTGEDTPSERTAEGVESQRTAEGVSAEKRPVGAQRRVGAHRRTDAAQARRR